MASPGSFAYSPSMDAPAGPISTSSGSDLHPSFAEIVRGDILYLLRSGAEEIANLCPLEQVLALRRGESLRIELTPHAARIKRKRRGGLLAPLIFSVYDHRRWTPRVRDAYLQAEKAGLPAARLLGFIVWAPGNRLSPLAMATEEVSGRPTLSERLIEGKLRDEALSCAGREIRRIHEAGLLHGDLNAANLLLGSDSGSPILLDLDDSRWFPSAVPDNHGMREIVRLARSLWKICALRGLPAPRGPCAALFDGYLEGEKDRLTEANSRLRSALRFRKWIW